MSDIRIPVPAGELVDKLTILELKLTRIADPDKRAAAAEEHDALMAVAAEHLPRDPELDRLRAALAEVNARLWETEDRLRACEAEARFGAEFVALARSVYHDNDARAALKRQISARCGSRLVEVKAHPAYPPRGGA